MNKNQNQNKGNIDESKSHPAVRKDDGRLAENRGSMSASSGNNNSSQQSKSGSSSKSSSNR